MPPKKKKENKKLKIVALIVILCAVMVVMVFYTLPTLGINLFPTNSKPKAAVAPVRPVGAVTTSPRDRKSVV